MTYRKSRTNPAPMNKQQKEMSKGREIFPADLFGSIRKSQALIERDSRRLFSPQGYPVLGFSLKFLLYYTIPYGVAYRKPPKHALSSPRYLIYDGSL